MARHWKEADKAIVAVQQKTAIVRGRACLAAIHIILFSHVVTAQQQDWEARAEAQAKRLIAKNGTGSDLELQRELLKMRDEDQGIRAQLAEVPLEQRANLTAEMESTDSRLTAQVKHIVSEKGWPTIRLVGADASQAASTILIHSPDHTWQAALLPRLQKLVKREEIFGSDIANLTDRILVSQGKAQVFGTQFKRIDEKMVMLPVIDPKHLQKRRARYLMPPMSVYRQLISEIYHLPAE